MRLDLPTRVLLEGEAETLTIRVTNTDTVECDITLSLVAPAFRLQPADNQRLVQLEPTASAEARWNLTPTTTGTSTLAVTTGNTSEQRGVSVITGNGFAPPQRATINYLGILFGALLAIGSLLGWITLQTRQRRRREDTLRTVDFTTRAAGAIIHSSATASRRAAPRVKSIPADVLDNTVQRRVVGRRAAYRWLNHLRMIAAHDSGESPLLHESAWRLAHHPHYAPPDVDAW